VESIVEIAIAEFEQIQTLIRVALAMAAGALIGLDREAANKPAGLRTNMLVSGASAFLVALGIVMLREFQGILGRELVRADPVRIVEAVITGISFLGAGTIIRNRDEGDIQGLTTAASLLFSAAVGIGVALGQWILSFGAVILVLVTLRLLPFLAYRLQPLLRRSEKD
jgi:putative Mg2+ transporter-C (MgtC) family protein